MDDDQTLCEYFLSANISWSVRAYSDVRGVPFTGEQNALKFLKEHDPDIYDMIERFYGVKNLKERVDISKSITDLVLAPAGGMWQDEELLAFGYAETEDLQKKGQELFRHLFSTDHS